MAGPSSARGSRPGSFQVEGGLMAGAAYRAVVRPEDEATTLSDRIRLKGGTTTLPPLTIRRPRTVTGSVRDRQGRPIAAALVFPPGGGPSTTTDEGGRFRLAGV